MAIGPDNQVTTTGLLNKPSVNIAAPDMSGLGPTQQTQGQPPAPMAERPAPEGAQDPKLDERIQNLNETEIAQLDGLLGPSNAAILKKIAPEASGIIDQFTSEEDVVSLPISAIKTYAIKIYGGGEQPDNNNVPPENIQASNPNGMMAQEPNTQDTDAIDQGLV